MSCFEHDGEVWKHIPAGGHGGGVTGSFRVKASKEEANAFRAAQHHGHSLDGVEKAAEQLEAAVAAAVGTTDE